MEFAEQMARLRVACETGHLPSDLGEWLLSELLESPSSARSLRNMLLCAAAEHLEGGRKERAIRLRSELLSLSRRTSELSAMQELLREATEIDPRCPCSVRQILRILVAGDNNRQTLSPDLGLGSKA